MQMPLLAWTATGVALSSFSANTLNQWFESPFDAQMGRTRGRPLPTQRLSASHAFSYAMVAGVGGVGLLAIKAGWLAAVLSGANIILYAALYTPLKRSSVANTWVGAVVGAIPPMIGYVAGGGGFDLGCLVLGATLYCWQFPHFNALSWNLRADYSRAGYCMASVLNPQLTVDSALRHSLALLPLSALVVYSGICDSWWFIVHAMPLHLGMVYLAYHFRRDPSRATARRLFLYSLLHLPLILLLMVLHHQYRQPDK
jgi:protoheme IX farnesyltransferase